MHSLTVDSIYIYTSRIIRTLFLHSQITLNLQSSTVLNNSNSAIPQTPPLTLAMAGVARIPNDIFQYSLHSAFKAGLTSAGPPATALNGYGTHGIGHIAGTAERESGDLLLLDGIPHLLLPDGTAKAPDRSTALAFVMVTNFQAETRAMVKELKMKGLGDVFASQGAGRGGRNSLMPFVVIGKFGKVVFKGGQVLSDVKGELFGFGVPAWAFGISSPGEAMRCCFLEAGGKRGGFVDDFEVNSDAVIEWAVTGRFHLGFPNGEDWQAAQLG